MGKRFKMQRFLNLKNAWQAKDLQARFSNVRQGKESRAKSLYVWQGLRPAEMSRIYQ